MSVSVVLPSRPKLPEAPRTLREPPEAPPEPSRRRTTEEIFGNPAKRQRLQQLTRRRVWKWILDPLLTTRKHIAGNEEDPLFYVLQFINK